MYTVKLYLKCINFRTACMWKEKTSGANLRGGGLICSRRLPRKWVSEWAQVGIICDYSVDLLAVACENL